MEDFTNLSLGERENIIIDEVSMYEDWMDKYQFLIELGNELPPYPAEYKLPQYEISGCQSQVWIYCEQRNGRIYFSGESDALIVRGIVALLIKVLSGATIAEVAHTDFAFIDAIGLKEHLSPTRSNGLYSMMQHMKLCAIAFETKNCE